MGMATASDLDIGRPGLEVPSAQQRDTRPRTSVTAATRPLVGDGPTGRSTVATPSTRRVTCVWRMSPRSSVTSAVAVRHGDAMRSRAVAPGAYCCRSSDSVSAGGSGRASSSSNDAETGITTGVGRTGESETVCDAPGFGITTRTGASPVVAWRRSGGPSVRATRTSTSTPGTGDPCGRTRDDPDRRLGRHRRGVRGDAQIDVRRDLGSVTSRPITCDDASRTCAATVKVPRPRNPPPSDIPSACRPSASSTSVKSMSGGGSGPCSVFSSKGA